MLCEDLARIVDCCDRGHPGVRRVNWFADRSSIVVDAIGIDEPPQSGRVEHEDVNFAHRSCAIDSGGAVSCALPGVAVRSRRRVPLTDELHEGLVWLCTDDSAATGDERGYASHAVFS